MPAERERIVERVDEAESVAYDARAVIVREADPTKLDAGAVPLAGPARQEVTGGDVVSEVGLT